MNGFILIFLLVFAKYVLHSLTVSRRSASALVDDSLSLSVCTFPGYAFKYDVSR